MKENSCNYEYSLNDDFFAALETTDIHKGNLKVNLAVKKGIATFSLDFHIEGIVVVSCDRCLDDMEVPVDTDNSLKVKFGAAYSDDDEIITIDEEDGCIDVAWNIYEFIALSLPIKHVHAPGECNEEMMGALSQHLRVTSDEEDEELYDEENGENPDEGELREIDPRWNALKKILNNN